MIYVGNAHKSQNTWVYAACSNSAVDVRDHAGPTHLIIRIVASYEVWAGVTHPPAAGLFWRWLFLVWWWQSYTVEGENTGEDRKSLGVLLCFLHEKWKNFSLGLLNGVMYY